MRPAPDEDEAVLLTTMLRKGRLKCLLELASQAPIYRCLAQCFCLQSIRCIAAFSPSPAHRLAELYRGLIMVLVPTRLPVHSVLFPSRTSWR